MARLTYGTEKYWLPDDFTGQNLQDILSAAERMRGVARFILDSGEVLLVHVGAAPLSVGLDAPEDDEEPEEPKERRAVIL